MECLRRKASFHGARQVRRTIEAQLQHADPSNTHRDRSSKVLGRGLSRNSQSKLPKTVGADTTACGIDGHVRVAERSAVARIQNASVHFGTTHGLRFEPISRRRNRSERSASYRRCRFTCDDASSNRHRRCNATRSYERSERHATEISQTIELDPERAAKSTRGIIRLGPIVIGEHRVVAAIAEERAAKFADVRRGLDPTGRRRVELA